MALNLVANVLLMPRISRAGDEDFLDGAKEAYSGAASARFYVAFLQRRASPSITLSASKPRESVCSASMNSAAIR